MGSGRNKNSPPSRFSMVGIVRKIPSTNPTQLNNNHHHNGELFAPPTAWNLLICPIRCREPLPRWSVKGAVALFKIN